MYIGNCYGIRKLAISACYHTPTAGFNLLRMLLGMKFAAEEYQQKYHYINTFHGFKIIVEDILIHECRDSFVEAVTDYNYNLICLLERTRDMSAKN